MTGKSVWEITYLLMRSNLVLFILFFAAAYASINIISMLDARYAEKGDELHLRFAIAIFSPADDSFTLVPRSQAEKCSNTGECYLIPKKEHARVNGQLESDYLAYEVLEKTENYSVIQTTDADDDNTVLSTYSVDKNNAITPIKTKMYYFGYMGAALLMAFCFVMLVKFSSFVIQFFVKRKYSAKAVAR